MKKLSISCSLQLLVNFCFAQSYRTETVDWLNPKIYKAKILVFRTDSVHYEAKNCKIFEFRTISGVTGYYIEGESSIEIETKQLNESLQEMLQQRGLKRCEIEEAQNSFYSGIEILSNMFLSCYQLEKGYNKNNKKS